MMDIALMAISYFIVIMGALILCALLAAEVMGNVGQGKPLRTWFFAGFAMVVATTIMLQWVVWDLMTVPLSLSLPAVYGAAFTAWTTSIVFWFLIVLKGATARPSTTESKEVQGESEIALRNAVSIMVAPHLRGAMLVQDGFLEALMSGDPGSPYDTQFAEATQEVGDEQ